MKKFISFLLTFVLLFSLTMPAMAAEVTGGNSGDVSASFNPGTIEFTGIAVDYEHEYRHNEETNTYKVDTVNKRIVGTTDGLSAIEQAI